MLTFLAIFLKEIYELSSNLVLVIFNSLFESINVSILRDDPAFCAYYLNIGTSLAIPLDPWCPLVSSRTGWTGVSML